MSRKPFYAREGLKKGPWTTEEDKKLISYIHEHGEGNWRDVPQKAGLERCGKSCRLRWVNYLDPGVKRGEFSYEEEQIIIILHASRGNNWSVIASHLPKRTDNEIKNYWNTHLKKRLIDQGIDPVTHTPLASNPNPATLKTSEFQDDDSSKSLPPPSSSCNLPEITSSDEIPRNDSSLSSKKRCFKRSSSTSKLLNKVAARASSIGNILPTSLEGTLRSPTLSQFSEHMIDNQEQDLGTSIDLSLPDYDFSQFLDRFVNNGDEAENIDGYNQDLLMSDFPSTFVDEDDINFGDITGWLSYPLDHPKTGQDSNDNNFL